MTSKKLASKLSAYIFEYHPSPLRPPRRPLVMNENWGSPGNEATKVYSCEADSEQALITDHNPQNVQDMVDNKVVNCYTVANGA